jgi:hypothetical protein
MNLEFHPLFTLIIEYNVQLYLNDAKNNAIVKQPLYIPMLGMKRKHINKHPKAIFAQT